MVEGDWSRLEAFMAERQRDRAGWLTLEALFDADDVPPARSSFLELFSGRGPSSPDVSWVPGERKGETVTPTSVGIRHGSGIRAVARLAEAGHTVPDGWRVVQDHPRRGLVLELDGDPEPARVLEWSVLAARLLSEIQLTGRWRATLHLRG